MVYKQKDTDNISYGIFEIDDNGLLLDVVLDDKSSATWLYEKQD